MVCKQLFKTTNGSMIRGFLPAKDKTASEVMLSEGFNLPSEENPSVVAEQNHIEEGDWVKNWLSTLGRVGA